MEILNQILDTLISFDYTYCLIVNLLTYFIIKIIDEFSSYCEFVAIAPQFDTHYNMPFSMSKVNKRNSTTEMLGTNGVHPSEQGYNQIADAVYRSIVANYCQ